MAFKVVWILSVLTQFAAVVLALRLNRRYRWHSAWLMISAAATMMAIQRVATLSGVWRGGEPTGDIFLNLSLWTASLATLLVSVLFLGGVALIEPLFMEIAKAQDVLKTEKQRLESTVHETEEELRLARHIQQNLLPKSAPNLVGFDVAGKSRAAEWTSGDFFDYIEMEDGTVTFVIADVSGHGTGPALLMAGTRALLRAYAQTHSDLGTMLTIANRSIAADVTLGRFVTVFLARIDPDTRTMVYAGAGHDAFLLDVDGEQNTLAATSPPLGALSDSLIESGPAVALKEGEVLLLVTDGILETQSPDNEWFGVERMLDVVRSHRHQPAAEIVAALFAAARAFSGDAPQRDDNTAVVIKIEKCKAPLAASSERSRPVENVKVQQTAKR